VQCPWKIISWHDVVKAKMGENDAIKVNPSGATIRWYHRLEERHDFKNAENLVKTATANVLSTSGIINFF
jgi:hypothetical protein